jgi:hypothetical protein
MGDTADGSHAEHVASTPVSLPGLTPRPNGADAAARGMQAAVRRLDADAQTIATQGPDIASLVDLGVQTHAYSALVQVIRASDELTRSTVDLLA